MMPADTSREAVGGLIAELNRDRHYGPLVKPLVTLNALSADTLEALLDERDKITAKIDAVKAAAKAHPYNSGLRWAVTLLADTDEGNGR